MAHQQHQSCIQACDACAAACDHCATACLLEPDVAEMVECIRHDMDCADSCRFASAVMARGSSRAKEVCSLCASVCDACAAECEKHQHEHCKQCAEACRNCAKECRAMGQ
ncbi:four-helix bundle copper-binding protein [Burkholderia sp. SG-MS1]|uniref:four-helix bundle copper-binding protein n=1 Tax=Paraburkholderia sp. SG-MS1 TaxID=2023741 RepID=UPI0014481D67|nr:four-helix bundle copper-binding protein [Paraburkholderia sp. SG-MS1]NKJ49352.1 four-helix bundle copper-binding protein [Paraburkholderia sp. SG-MS1]